MVDTVAPPCVPCPTVFRSFFRLLNHETYLPAQQSAPRAHPWLPRPYGHAEWSQSFEPEAGERPQAADPLRYFVVAVGAVGGPHRARLRFQRSQVLRTGAQFQGVYRQGRRFGNELLTAAVCANLSGLPRLGLSIAARTVGNAVARNRLRRVIRESFRLRQPELPAVDIVIGARNAARAAAADAVRMALGKLWTEIIATCAK
jgi:ribonuclease P protein component